MNEIRIGELIDRFFDCDLDGDDRAALERALLRSPQARGLFWRKAEIHDGLRDWGLTHWDRLGDPPAARQVSHVVAAPTWGRAIRAAAIPLAVFVGSLVGVGVGAGAAWAVVPQVRQAVTVAMRLVNGGFEDDEAAPAMPAAAVTHLEGLPTRFGEWGGDGVRVCGPEHGIIPAEGAKMLALERALTGPGSRAIATARSCDLFQLVDLSPYRHQIKQGGCTLELAARFLDGGAARPLPTNFVVRIHLFSGEPGDVVAGWPESRLDALATSTERVASPGGDPVGWREISTQAIVPKGATFAIVLIDATSMDLATDSPPAVFDRHYCDDVRLALTMPSRAEPDR